MKKCSCEFTSFLIEKITTIFETELDFSDPRLPHGICETCRVVLLKKDNGESVKLPTFYKFETICVRPRLEVNVATASSARLES